MPPQGEVARQWFIPGEGIDRGVISADIQRYLGNDATVRPGAGTGEYQGVNGYWIKAYRNLTSAMIADLRADSLRWRQEQRQTGSGQTSYVGSRTYDESNAAGIQRRSGDSPSLDAYGNPTPSGRPGRPPGDQMQIDPVGGRQPQGQGFPPQGGYYPDARGQQYPQDPTRYPGQQPQRDGRAQQRGPEYGQEYINNPYPSPAATTVGINQGARERDPFANQQSYAAAQPQYDQYGRAIPPQGRPAGYPDQPMTDVYGQPDSYGRYPVNQPSYQDRNAPNYQATQVPPAGYTRQGEYYVPNTSGFGQTGMPATSGPEQAYYPGQQQQQQRGPQNQAYPTYAQEPEYPPQRSQPSAHGRQQPPTGGDERRRRNR